MLTGLDSVTPFLKTSPEETQRQWKGIYKITAALFQIVENTAEKKHLNVYHAGFGKPCQH